MVTILLLIMILIVETDLWLGSEGWALICGAALINDVQPLYLAVAQFYRIWSLIYSVLHCFTYSVYNALLCFALICGAALINDVQPLYLAVALFYRLFQCFTKFFTALQCLRFSLLCTDIRRCTDQWCTAVALSYRLFQCFAQFLTFFTALQCFALICGAALSKSNDVLIVTLHVLCMVCCFAVFWIVLWCF